MSKATETQESILVLGAGELGTAVIEALARHPGRGDRPITVLLRPSSLAPSSSTDTAKRQQLDHLRSLPGVTLEGGDIQADSEAELAAVFGRHHTVVSCTGFGAPPGTQVKLTRAVLRAGSDGLTRRYFPWQWGMDYDAIGEGSAQDLFDEQLQVRKLLRSQPPETGVDWVIVSTGLFMSFLFLPNFGPVDIPNRTLRALGSWDTTISVTAIRDVGAAAAELVFDPRDVARQAVYVAGDTVSYGQVADLVEKRFGGDDKNNKFKREVWELDFLNKRAFDKPADGIWPDEIGMFKYQAVFAAGRGVSFDQAQTLNYQRGLKFQTVESYLQDMKV